MHAGAVLAQGIAQAVFDFTAVFALIHVDEVDDDQSAQITQTHLARHFIGGFQIGAGRGFFDVTTFDRTRRVHVHRNQRFGMVNHDYAAAGQFHFAGVSGFDLVFDLKATEQRRIVAVTLHFCGVFGHDVRHELLRLLEHIVGVDENIADVVVEIIADSANHQAGFLVNQERTFAVLRRAVNRAPQFQQVIQIPLQFGCGASDAGGAGDDGHTVGVFELVERFFQLGTGIAFNAPTHAAAARIVGH